MPCKDCLTNSHDTYGQSRMSVFIRHLYVTNVSRYRRLTRLAEVLQSDKYSQFFPAEISLNWQFVDQLNNYTAKPWGISTYVHQDHFNWGRSTLWYVISNMAFFLVYFSGHCVSTFCLCVLFSDSSIYIACFYVFFFRPRQNEWMHHIVTCSMTCTAMNTNPRRLSKCVSRLLDTME